MRLWFAPSSEVPIYRQLVTQVTLAILSGELKPGARLPSTRELARRFSVHPNTISAGYKLLEQEGWAERRQGSGVYVRDTVAARDTPEQILDYHIAGFFQAVRELNLPETAVRARVALWLASQRPDHFLLVDPDPLLRQILMTEIGQASRFPVKSVSVEDCTAEALATAVVLCRPSKTAMVRSVLPAGVEVTTLQIRSANAWLKHWLPIAARPLAEGAMVGVVSHWPDFLNGARTMLIAAGMDPEAMLVRDARERGWKQGLEQTVAILCDAYTASMPGLPKKPARIVFGLLADAAKEELARHAAR